MTSTKHRAGPGYVCCVRRSPAAKLRLVCFPYAGGTNAVFRQWPEFMSATVEIHSLDLPGRGNRIGVPPFTRLPSLIDALLPDFELHLNRPFAFFGHSMGGLIAYELAVALRDRGLAQPAHIFLSAHPAPQLPLADPPIHALPDSAFIARLRELQGTPEEVLHHGELMEVFLPILRSDFMLCETYAYRDRGPLNAAISVFGALSDPRVTRVQLEAWRFLTTNSFRIRMFPGGHFFLNDARLQLLQAISEDLNSYLL